ncbi:hypothetical protein QYE76_016955 [Lolium multiflorum]|uniref:Uncharacterized protein n=1 Tax=Lolium multiflorum TaxID=4521 RepID=A0AAD8UX41_LOLMU|nr:hypothetical protein QYE76_016955 [Lolium multiflorum]
MLDINLFRTDRGGDPELVRNSQRRRGKPVELVDRRIRGNAMGHAATTTATAMSLPPADGGDDWFLHCGILEDLPAAACGAFPWDASASSSNPRSALRSHLLRHIDSLM